jgi:hypothetical protein
MEDRQKRKCPFMQEMPDIIASFGTISGSGKKKYGDLARCSPSSAFHLLRFLPILTSQFQSTFHGLSFALSNQASNS